MILKLSMLHTRVKLLKGYTNDDPGLTLTYFTTSLVAYAFELGKLLESHLMGNPCSK